jgi:hypothetical protein
MPAPKNNKNALKKEGVKESHIHFRVTQELIEATMDVRNAMWEMLDKGSKGEF